MKRKIIGFHQDKQQDWIADLECSHGQHVRHKPPFFNRPWVESEAGRAGMLGAELDCVLCDCLDPNTSG
jgi:tellurite methyltransferase